MDNSKQKQPILDEKITKELEIVKDHFKKLILNISKNNKTNTEYSFNTEDINCFVIDNIRLILSIANKFLHLDTEKHPHILKKKGGRDVELLLKNEATHNSIGIVGKSATASVTRTGKESSASKLVRSDKELASKSVKIYKDDNIQEVILTKEEVVEKQKLYEIFRENCKIHFNSDYTQYYNATIFYRKLLYKNFVENLNNLLYFYINYKLEQQNEQSGSIKNGGNKQKGGLTLPLCKEGSDYNRYLGPIKNADKNTYPNFITELHNDMKAFLGSKLTIESVEEFSSIFQSDLSKDLKDGERARIDLTTICLSHLPKYLKMSEQEFTDLLSNPAAIITGKDFLKPDNYRLVVNTYSIHDTTPSGLKAQIESWRSDGKLIIIPNISGRLDSAEHSNGGIYDAYDIVKHSNVFKEQLNHIINPAIKALKNFYISLEEINIKIEINDNNEIVLIVNRVGEESNNGIEVKFGANGISTVSGVVNRLLKDDLDDLLKYLEDNGFSEQEATDISLFIKHMGDSLQFIQALYHNTEFDDDDLKNKQINCNKFINDKGQEITIETQNDTAFLTCDRSAFKAAKALNCNVVIGVGDTKCNSEPYDKIYWRVVPLIVGLTRIQALKKFFKFCVPYSASSSQAASSQAASSQAASSQAASSQAASSQAASSQAASSGSYMSDVGDVSDVGGVGDVSDVGGVDNMGASGGSKGASGGRKGASGSRKGASGSRKGASGGRKGASGGRKGASGGRKGASGGTLPGEDSDMSTSDSTNDIVANSSGLLYRSVIAGSKTNTTIYLCFTDEKGDIQIDKTFFIDTFDDLDLTDTGTLTQENANHFQLIITKIFETALIELDSEKYVRMLKKMEEDIKGVELYSSEFNVAFEKNTKTLDSLSKQLSNSRTSKVDGIIKTAIADYKISFENTLNRLTEIKKMVDDWRLKLSVKFNNRKTTIQEFIEKIKVVPEDHIKSTMISCEKSLEVIAGIITKFETFDEKQKELTVRRVETSSPIFGNSAVLDKSKDKSNAELMSKVSDAVNTFIITLNLKMEKLRKEKIDSIKKSSQSNIKKTNEEIDIEKKNITQINKELEELKKLKEELKKDLKSKKEGLDLDLQGLNNSIDEKKKLLTSKKFCIKKLSNNLKIEEKKARNAEKEVAISFIDALKDLQINITDHTDNLMYFLKVEKSTVAYLRARPSFNKKKRKGVDEDEDEGKGKQSLQVIPEDEDLDDMSDTHDEADSAATGSSSKKSKVTITGGGKLLNKKVRIHKAKSISQKTISGEKKKKITKVIKNKELLSIKKSRAKPTKAMRLG
jgi:hypothetical protein